MKVIKINSLQRVSEYQRFDGWFNNLANPQWGSVGSRLHRDAPSSYQDGVYRLDSSLPSARVISGQVIAYEIMQSTQNSCPLEMHKIPVERCDPIFDKDCEGKTDIPFTRAKYDKGTGHGLNSPREQINERTSWIDASFLYSTQEPWVAALRSFENGTLLEGPMPGYPPFNDPHIPLINPPPPQIHRLMNPERLFILGDPRINENPGLLSFGLILFRWHNIQALRLQQEFPEWTDEELFQGARRLVIATLQSIVLYEFLPVLLSISKEEIPEYQGYNPHVPPGISHSFATTAFRFPHTLVPPALLLRKRNGNFLGMASQIAEDEDHIVVEDLRDFIFGPMHFTRLDKINKLANLYDFKIDRLDAYVGGMLEADGNGPGELFSAIIKDQFLRLRESDRFWFENRQNGLFTDREIFFIRRITLRDIIRQTTSIGKEDIQENVKINLNSIQNFVLIKVCIGIGYLLVQRRKKMGMLFEPGAIKKQNQESTEDEGIIAKDQKLVFPAIEWLNETFCRSILVELNSEYSQLKILKRRSGGILRKLDFGDVNVLRLTVTKSGSVRKGQGPFVCISLPKNYDIVLRLRSKHQWSKFRSSLGNCLLKHGKLLKEVEAENDVLLEAAETKDKRQSKLDHFFREAYSRAFNDPALSDSSQISNTNFNSMQQVMAMTLTKAEFAEALGMRTSDLFVQRMFACMAANSNEEIDGGNDTVVTFQEFLDVLRKFTQGSLREKLQLVFDMCDLEREGRVQRKQFCEFVKSLNIAAGVRIDQEVQDQVLECVLKRAGVDPERDILTYKDFEAIFSQMVDIRRPVGVHLRGVNMRINLEETQSLNSFAVTSEVKDPFDKNSISLLLSYLESYRQHIVILFLFFAANAIVFLERFWFYRYENEHRDLRRVMGVGIAITRGAAAALSFDMALILLTVCRNILTILRESFVGEYIPLDSAITFHKIVAITAGVFAAIHTIGHCVNFYHVATQSQEGLACLFQEAVFGSNFLPSIYYWFFQTLTGLTGILLVALMSIIYVFSAPAVMKRAYHAFRLTHLLNILLYAFTILHGLPKLLDSPKFWYIVLGPTIIFIIDRIIGMRKQYKQLRIVEAAVLPSDIIYIQFKRPHSFKFRSGQWVRISCPALSCAFNEHHAFSLASAPQAQTLALFIKAVGPWTWSLRNEITEAQENGLVYPVLNLDGPYGDGNQEWYNHEVVVMVGGGIGVTPYASTLMDLVLERASGNHSGIRCKRYICEKHFRGNNSGHSMFTGLRATNHFGRPNFDLFFKFLQSRHQDVSDIGVFSCGPAQVNKQIRRACTEANRIRNAPSFVHRFETF
uniref:NAD(P)H oxidase (H2O2-forming) n=1 Tax=Meloidogyne javanica TaxID=6303 RepID=A0A915MH54_MELJA